MANNGFKPTSLGLNDLAQLMTGLIIQGLLNGALLFLGIASIFLFYVKRRNNADITPTSRRRSVFWILYILLLLPLNLAGPLVLYCLHFVVPLYYRTQLQAGLKVPKVVPISLLEICLDLIFTLTDGLLVSLISLSDRSCENLRLMMR